MQQWFLLKILPHRWSQHNSHSRYYFRKHLTTFSSSKSLSRRIELKRCIFSYFSRLQNDQDAFGVLNSSRELKSILEGGETSVLREIQSVPKCRVTNSLFIVTYLFCCWKLVLRRCLKPVIRRKFASGATDGNCSFPIVGELCKVHSRPTQNCVYWKWHLTFAELKCRIRASIIARRTS